MKLTDFLQVKEAAELLGVSADTLRRWEKVGKISPQRHPMNNYRLYRVDELNQILEELYKTGGVIQ